MIVCVCRRVSDRQIREAAAGGVTTLDELRTELGVATGCGRCADCACDVLERARCASTASVAWMASPRPALAVGA